MRGKKQEAEEMARGAGTNITGWGTHSGVFQGAKRDPASSEKGK